MDRLQKKRLEEVGRSLFMKFVVINIIRAVGF